MNYTARVYHGGLTYNESSTLYLTSGPSHSASSRPFAFTNEYRELVSVMNVYLSFEAAEYFQVLLPSVFVYFTSELSRLQLHVGLFFRFVISNLQF